jgi:hypothetical protein
MRLIITLCVRDRQMRMTITLYVENKEMWLTIALYVEDIPGNHHLISGKQIYEADLSFCTCKEMYPRPIITPNVHRKWIYKV